MTDEWVVHTPDEGAIKWWIGNAAEDGRAATVFARLKVPAADGARRAAGRQWPRQRGGTRGGRGGRVGVSTGLGWPAGALRRGAALHVLCGHRVRLAPFLAPRWRPRRQRHADGPRCARVHRAAARRGGPRAAGRRDPRLRLQGGRGGAKTARRLGQAGRSAHRGQRQIRARRLTPAQAAAPAYAVRMRTRYRAIPAMPAAPHPWP